MAELHPYSLTPLASPFPLSLYPIRYESSFKQRTQGIRGFFTGYLFSISTILMFIIFLPIFFRDGRIPIAAYFITLSLTNSLRRSTFVLLIRAVVQLFEINVSFTRVQVQVSRSLDALVSSAAMTLVFQYTINSCRDNLCPGLKADPVTNPRLALHSL